MEISIYGILFLLLLWIKYDNVRCLKAQVIAIQPTKLIEESKLTLDEIKAKIISNLAQSLLETNADLVRQYIDFYTGQKLIPPPLKLLISLNKEVSCNGQKCSLLPPDPDPIIEDPVDGVIPNENADEVILSEAADQIAPNKAADQIAPDKAADEIILNEAADEITPNKAADQIAPDKAADEIILNEAADLNQIFTKHVELVNSPPDQLDVEEQISSISDEISDMIPTMGDMVDGFIIVHSKKNTSGSEKGDPSENSVDTVLESEVLDSFDEQIEDQVDAIDESPKIVDSPVTPNITGHVIIHKNTSFNEVFSWNQSTLNNTDDLLTREIESVLNSPKFLALPPKEEKNNTSETDHRSQNILPPVIAAASVATFGIIGVGFLAKHFDIGFLRYRGSSVDPSTEVALPDAMADTSNTLPRDSRNELGVDNLL